MHWIRRARDRVDVPPLRFGSIFATALLAGGLLLQAPFVARLLWPVKTATASVVASALRMLGGSALAVGNTVHLADQSLVIIDECTGVYGWGLLSAFIVAFPASPRRRLAGLAMSIPFVGVANLVRLVVLGLVIDRYPERVDLVHDYLWQVVWAALLVGFAVGHAAWTRRRPGDPTAIPATS